MKSWEDQPEELEHANVLCCFGFSDYRDNYHMIEIRKSNPNYYLTTAGNIYKSTTFKAEGADLIFQTLKYLRTARQGELPGDILVWSEQSWTNGEKWMK